MSWKISQISSSLLGLLREREAAPSLGSLPQLEHIRERMLQCMASFLEAGALRPAVWSKVQYADDIQALWYLRSDVMQLLSGHCGETLAASELAALTELFRGHLPAAQFASARRRA
jgi:hypothetical protein